MAANWSAELRDTAGAFFDDTHNVLLMVPGLI